MQPALRNGAASAAGSKQLAEEAKPKLEGSACPQAGQEHPKKQGQEQWQAQAQVGQPVQGTQLPFYVPSLTYEMLTTLPAAAFPGLLDTQDLLNFNSQEAWAQFNSSFPTESFPPGPFDQQAGATVEDLFSLNDELFFNPAAAFDTSALPQVKVNVSQSAPLLSSSPSIPTHTRTRTHHGTAPHGKPHLLLYIQPSRLHDHFAAPIHSTVAPYCRPLLAAHLCFLAFASPRRSFPWNLTLPV